MRVKGKIDWPIVICTVAVLLYVILGTVAGINQLFLGLTGITAALIVMYASCIRRIKAVKNNG